MSKIKYIVIEKNKPSEQAIKNFNRIVYSYAKSYLEKENDKNAS